jgi:hypothetical protein
VRLLFTLALGGLSGCFSPSLNEIACGPFRECPQGLVCAADEICRPAGPLDDADASVDTPSFDGPDVFDVAHLPPGSESPGTADLTLDGDQVIDTTRLDGVAAPFQIVTPSDGPELAVLRVATLAITAGANVRVEGIRPLIIIASGDVTIDGIIDAAARQDAGGPGAVLGGRGGDGVTAGGFFSGGGGGGFSTSGGAGGATEGAQGGEAGGRDPAISILAGGSPGGAAAAGSGCERPGGGGGGALQISTPGVIAIGESGQILAGGGGGPGGVPCPGGVGGPGGGGGSGGAVYLQAPSVVHRGLLAANGGGGGGGSGDDGGEEGDPGGDALGIDLAAGGNAGNDGGDGGDGGDGTSAATSGAGNDTDNGAGGGGGGAVGRIAVEGALSGSGASSPAIVFVAR